jgi:predicted nuclease of predicted toxin-antitoxin system
MRLLADENVRKRLVRVLKESGRDVKVAKKGTKNSALFLLAKKEKRILLTNDTEFSDDKLYPPDKTSGIILLRVFPDTFENQREALLRLLGRFKESEFFGKLVELGKNWEIFTK